MCENKLRHTFSMFAANTNDILPAALSPINSYLSNTFRFFMLVDFVKKNNQVVFPDDCVHFLIVRRKKLDVCIFENVPLSKNCSRKWEYDLNGFCKCIFHVRHRIPISLHFGAMNHQIRKRVTNDKHAQHFGCCFFFANVRS